MSATNDNQANDPNAKFLEDIQHISQVVQAASARILPLSAQWDANMPQLLQTLQHAQTASAQNEAWGRVNDFIVSFVQTASGAIREIRTANAEFPPIARQMTFSWDQLSESDRQATLDLYANLVETERATDQLHLLVASARQNPTFQNPRLRRARNALQQSADSIRDDARQLREIVTELTNLLDRYLP